jgi:hypothetical protein
LLLCAHPSYIRCMRSGRTSDAPTHPYLPSTHTYGQLSISRQTCDAHMIALCHTARCCKCCRQTGCMDGRLSVQISKPACRSVCMFITSFASRASADLLPGRSTSSFGAADSEAVSLSISVA